MTDAIAALLKDPQRREQLAADGMKRIEEKFCWRVAARQMIQYYRQVLSHADR